MDSGSNAASSGINSQTSTIVSPLLYKNREHGYSGETSWFERPSQITSAMVWHSFIRPSHRFNRYADCNVNQPNERLLPQRFYPVVCAPAHTPNDPPHAARGHFALSSTRQVIFHDNDGNQEAVVYFCPLASD